MPSLCVPAYSFIFVHHQIFLLKGCLIIQKSGEIGLCETLATIRKNRKGANTRPETEL